MTDEPRTVTPQEATKMLSYVPWWHIEQHATDLARTVATEPDRTRAAVVKVLRGLRGQHAWHPVDFEHLQACIENIENGADW